MEKFIVANLTVEEMKQLKQLESKLNVALVAYAPENKKEKPVVK